MVVCLRLAADAAADADADGGAAATAGGKRYNFTASLIINYVGKWWGR